MKSNNTLPDIADRAPPEKPAEPPATGPDPAAPPAPTADNVEAATPAADAAQPAEPCLRWRNQAWAVTEFGIEPRTVMANGLPLPCEIAASDLLRTRTGMPGVSDWALHVASKSWCANPDEFLDALAQALSIHHPGQTSVDMVATSEQAHREFSRSRGRDASQAALGLEYVPGEATLRAADRPAAASGEGPKQDGVPDFVEAYEPEPPPGFDDRVEELIEEEIEKRHRRRTDGAL